MVDEISSRFVPFVLFTVRNFELSEGTIEVPNSSQNHPKMSVAARSISRIAVSGSRSAGTSLCLNYSLSSALTPPL